MHRRVVQWLLAPVALMVLGNGSAGAQTIAGRVIDAKSRLPLRLVTVQLFDDSGHVAATARTDTAGIFYGLLSAPGRFRLHFALDSVMTFDSEPVAVEADGFVEREFVVPLLRVFTKSEVGKQVQTRADSPQPRYPSLLAAANIEGEVVAHLPGRNRGSKGQPDGAAALHLQAGPRGAAPNRRSAPSLAALARAPLTEIGRTAHLRGSASSSTSIHRWLHVA